MEGGPHSGFLHNSGSGLTSPYPGRIHATTTDSDLQSAVKSLRIAARICFRVSRLEELSIVADVRQAAQELASVRMAAGLYFINEIDAYNASGLIIRKSALDYPNPFKSLQTCSP